MKKFLGVLAGLALTAGAAQAANLTLFFSSDDPFAGTGRVSPTLPGGVAVAAAATPLNSPTVGNPSVPGGRLHMWVTGNPGDPDPNVWNGIAFNVVISGPATITGGGGLNITSGSPTFIRRWETGSDLTPPTFNFVAVTRTGAQFPPLVDGWDDGVDAVYMGYLDFAANNGTSEVKFQVGNSGITRAGGSPTVDDVNFGAGDAALRGNQFGEVSTLADATITPEPTSLLLLGLAGLALRRR